MEVFLLFYITYVLHNVNIFCHLYGIFIYQTAGIKIFSLYMYLPNCNDLMEFVIAKFELVLNATYHLVSVCDNKKNDLLGWGKNF